MGIINGFLEALKGLWLDSGFTQLAWQNYVMIVVACFLLYLAIKKQYEPLLLLPIAFTCNLEFAVPVVAGLLFAPGAAVGTAFTVVIVKFLLYVEQNAILLSNSEISPETVENFRALIDALLRDRATWIMAGAFAAAAEVSAGKGYSQNTTEKAGATLTVTPA